MFLYIISRLEHEKYFLSRGEKVKHLKKYILTAAFLLAALSANNEKLFFLQCIYRSPQALAQARTEDLEKQIRSTGFFRSKARALIKMAASVAEDHGSVVPRQMKELIALPGVGRKTANVVLGHALGVPGLPVDRHVLRVANRLNIATSTKPESVERQLCEALPKKNWTKASDILIRHGRRICKPRPLCSECCVASDCPSIVSATREPTTKLQRSTQRVTKTK